MKSYEVKCRRHKALAEIVKEICSLMEISIKKIRKSVVAAQASIINVSFSSISSAQITVSDLNSDIISPSTEIGLEDPIESNFGGGFAEDFERI